MNSQARNEQLAWLADENIGENECRVLTNVRCLSEGIDVPALDAVLFLSSRNSQYIRSIEHLGFPQGTA